MCDFGVISVPTMIAIATTVASTAISIAGQQQQAKAAKAQASFTSQVANNNAIIAQRQATDARRRGKIAASQQRLKSRQLIGLQRTALAGNRQEVDVGSALDITSDTTAIGELDALTIRSNFEREALGFEQQSSNFVAEAQLAALKGANAQTAANIASAGSFVSGLGKVASKWNNFSTPTDSFAEDDFAGLSFGL